MIISFAWTKEQLLSGKKTESRRDWKDRTLKAWQNAWDQGRHVHLAADKVLYAGGRGIAYIKLTARPERQALFFMTDANLKAEGGMCKTVAGFCQFVKKKTPEKQMVVIKFELQKLIPADPPPATREQTAKAPR